MAIVGDAYVVVRAVTSGVEEEIARAFSGVKGIGDDVGEETGDAFSRSFARASGRSDPFRKFKKEAEETRKEFNRLIRIGYSLGPVFALVAGAIGALGTGLFVLGAGLGQTVPTLIILPSVLTAILNSVVALKLAFSGVGDAIKKGLKPSKAATDAAKKAIRDAQQGVQKAKEALARTETRQAEALTDAEYALIESKKELVDLETEAANAQKNVTQAYIDGKRALDDLAFSAEDAALKQEGAGISLEKARESLARVQDLPPNSRARREAELAFKEAELAYRRTTDTNKKLQEDNSKAQAAGVDGTKEVLDAKAKALAADEAVAAKKAAMVTAELMQLRMVRDQQWELKDAQDAVRDAEERLADAQKASKSTTNEYLEALSKLPPAAADFVKYIVSLKPLIDELKNTAAQNFFPPFKKGLEELVNNGFKTFKKVIGETAKALGEAGGSFLSFLGSARSLSNISLISETNVFVIKKFGKIMENLVGLFQELLVAADPLIRRFFTYAENVTASWKATAELKNKNNELTDSFNKAGDRAAEFGEIIGNFFGAIRGLAKAADPAITLLLDHLKEASASFEKFAKAPENQPALQKFFLDSTTNFIALGSLIKEILKSFLKIGADPNLGIFLRGLEPVVKEFEGLAIEAMKGGPAMAGFLTEFAKFLKLTTESGAISMFFNILKEVLKVLNSIFGSEIGKKVLLFLGIFKAITLAVGTVVTAFKFFGMAVAGSFLKVQGAVSKVAAGIRGMKSGDPFAMIRKSSGMTRTELQKQMIIDRQKKDAMRGIYTSGQQAATSIQKLGVSSKTATPLISQGGVASRTAAGMMRGIGAAGTMAATGFRKVGASLMTLTGGPLGILLILVPLIIANWDKIVEFFKNLPAKLYELGQKIWSFITEQLPVVIEKVKTWVTETMLPFLASLPGKMLELYVNFWTWIFDLIKKVLPMIGSWFTDTFFPFLASLPGKMLAAYVNFWTWIFDLIKQVLPKITSWFTDTFFPFLAALPGKMLKAYANFWGWIFDVLKTGWDKVSNFFSTTVLEFLKSLPGRFAKGAGNIWSFLVDGIKSAVNMVINTLNKMIAAMNRIKFKIPDIAGVPGRGTTVGFNVSPIPTLARGGVIPASPGGTLARIGEAGRPERVEPLDEDGLSKRDRALVTMLAGGQGSGATINVYPSEGMDESELASLVSRQIAFQMRRGGV